MKLIDILKEDNDNSEELINYAKFIFENFLEYGSFEYNGNEYKWHLPQINGHNVFYSISVNKQPRLDFVTAIIYYDDKSCWEDHESIHNISSNTSSNKHYIEKHFFSKFKEIVNYHNVEFIREMHKIKFKPMKFYQKENYQIYLEGDEYFISDFNKFKRNLTLGVG